MVVETYIKDLEDGDMLMDMMSANAGFERTITKRGENFYPEVPTHSSPLPNHVVFFLRTDPSRHPIPDTTFRSPHHLAVQFPRSHGLESHSRGTTVLDCWTGKYQQGGAGGCCCDTDIAGIGVAGDDGYDCRGGGYYEG